MSQRKYVEERDGVERCKISVELHFSRDEIEFMENHIRYSHAIGTVEELVKSWAQSSCVYDRLQFEQENERRRSIF